MADINKIMNNLYSDIKAVGQEVGRRTGDAVELSKLKLEHLKVKNRIKEDYERLGEIVYGGYKNEEDVSDVIAVLYEQLDEDFEELEQIYSAINCVKAGYSVYSEANAAFEEEQAEPAPDENTDTNLISEISEAAKDAKEEIEDEIEEIFEEAESFVKNNDELDINED